MLSRLAPGEASVSRQGSVATPFEAPAIVNAGVRLNGSRNLAGRSQLGVAATGSSDLSVEFT